MNELRESFNESNDEIIDVDSGFRILNGDLKHLWFRDNIAFFFITGKIFDDNDKELLTNILSYFNHFKRTYLGNFYKILNFNDILTQKFEKKLNIGNGNYHFILIVISYPILDDIKFSPDPKFMNRGIVDYYVDTKRVKERMIEFMREYGLVAQLEEEVESVDPVTVNNSFTHRDIQWGLGDELDHELMGSELKKTIQRTRQCASQRDKQPGIDQRNVIPLNKRIKEKGSDVLSIPIPYRAVYSRMTDTLQIDKNQHTYQLYDGEEDYMMKIMP